MPLNQVDISMMQDIPGPGVVGKILTSDGTDWINADAPGAGGEANAPDTAITTADQTWTGSQRSALLVDNDGSFDMDAGQNFKCTPSGNFTLTFTNMTNGQSGFIVLDNAGGHTVSLDATSKADANLATTTTTAGTYILSYISDGTNAYLTNSAVIA